MKRGSKVPRKEFRSAAWAPESITRETPSGLARCTGYARLDGATGRAIVIGTLARAGGDANARGRYVVPLAITTGCLGAATERSAVCCALAVSGVQAKKAPAIAERNTRERRIRPHVLGVEEIISAFRSVS
jgi:hypothetical protein